MTHFSHFEQLDRRGREPRQEFERVSGTRSFPASHSGSIDEDLLGFYWLTGHGSGFRHISGSNAQAVVATPPLLMLALQVIFAGTMLAAGAVLFAGIPLAVVAWRSTPRIRFLFAVPFLACALPLLVSLLIPFLHIGRFLGPIFFLFAGIPLAVVAWRSTPRIRFLFAVPFLACALPLLVSLLIPFLHIGRFLGPIFFIVGLFYGIPIISTIAINRAIRQAALPDKWLRFARLPSRLVVFALIMMFLGLLSWGIYIAVFAPTLFFSLSAPLNLPPHGHSCALACSFLSSLLHGPHPLSHARITTIQTALPLSVNRRNLLLTL